jgi:hypothetical protein
MADEVLDSNTGSITLKWADQILELRVDGSVHLNHRVLGTDPEIFKGLQYFITAARGEPNGPTT